MNVLGANASARIRPHLDAQGLAVAAEPVALLEQGVVDLFRFHWSLPAFSCLHDNLASKCTSSQLMGDAPLRRLTGAGEGYG
jgi:hypothetical protein